MKKEIIQLLQNTNVDLSNYEYVAVDKDGEVAVYLKKPRVSNNYSWYYLGYKIMGDVGYTEDWKHCCWEIKSILPIKKEPNHTKKSIDMEQKLIDIIKKLNFDITEYLYVAVDEDGTIDLHKSKPYETYNGWDSRGCITIGDMGYTEDWKHCCWEIEDLMPKYTLDYVLERNGRNVVFYIIAQDERLTTKTSNQLEFKYDGFKIISHCIPVICQGTVFIRGFKQSQDDSVTTLRFDSEEEAQRYIDEATEALEALKCKGFPREAFTDEPKRGDHYWVYDDVKETYLDYVWYNDLVDRTLFKHYTLYKKEY